MSMDAAAASNAAGGNSFGIDVTGDLAEDDEMSMKDLEFMSIKLQFYKDFADILKKKKQIQQQKQEELQQIQ